MNEDIDNMSTEEIMAEIAALENQQSSTGYGFPKAPDKDSVLKLFRDLINSDDSKKVSHLDNSELIRTRGYLDVGLYSDAEGLEKVSTYIESKAENIFATGMSKKGFFAQLIVTQIKKEQKIIPQIQEKKGWLSFGKKNQEQGVDNL